MVDEMGLGLRDRLRLNYVNAECWIRGSDVVKIGVGWGHLYTRFKNDG